MFGKLISTGDTAPRVVVRLIASMIVSAVSSFALVQSAGAEPVIVEAQDENDTISRFIGIPAGPSSVIIMVPFGLNSIEDADSTVQLTIAGKTVENVVLNEEFSSDINQKEVRASVILLDLALPEGQGDLVQPEQSEENLDAENIVTVRSYRISNSGELRPSNAQQQTVQNENGAFVLSGMTESSLPLPLPLGGVVYDKCGNLNALALPTSSDGLTTLFSVNSLVGMFGGNSVATPFPVSEEACAENTGTSKTIEFAQAALDEAERVQQEQAAEIADLKQAAAREQQRLQELRESNARKEKIDEATARLDEIIAQQEESAARQEAVNEQLSESRDLLRTARTAAEEAVGGEARATEELKMWRYILYGVGGLTVIAIGVLVWLALRSRRLRKNLAAVKDEKRDIEEARAAAEATWHDCVLESEDGLTVKLPGSKLVHSRGGVTIGRSREESDVVIDRDDVSRRHARIDADGDVVRITDLGSTNKTRVNGVTLDQGVSRQLYEGDRIEFGVNAFTFKIFRR